MNRTVRSAASVAGILLALYSAAPAARAQAAAVPTDGTSWIASDTVTHTVMLRLVVTRPPGGPSALIDGYRSGIAQVIVPLNWTVKWDWKSLDSTSTHSIVVMGEREKLPLEGGRRVLSAVQAILAADIPVMGHVGLTPQSFRKLGGFKVQGRESDSAREIVEDARTLADAGSWITSSQTSIRAQETFPWPASGVGYAR